MRETARLTASYLTPIAFLAIVGAAVFGMASDNHSLFLVSASR